MSQNKSYRAGPKHRAAVEWKVTAWLMGTVLACYGVGYLVILGMSAIGLWPL